MQHILRFALAAGLAMTAVAGHAVAPYMNYQGRLLDNDGQAMTSGPLEMRVNIYNVVSGGTPVWGPFHFDLAPTQALTSGHAPKANVLADGRFNVIIGPTDTTNRGLSLPFKESGSTGQLYVELSVTLGGTVKTIEPRSLFLTAPFAFQAKHMENLYDQDGWLWAPSSSGLTFSNAASEVKASKFNGVNQGDITIPAGTVNSRLTVQKPATFSAAATFNAPATFNAAASFPGGVTGDMNVTGLVRMGTNYTGIYTVSGNGGAAAITKVFTNNNGMQLAADKHICFLVSHKPHNGSNTNLEATCSTDADSGVWKGTVSYYATCSFGCLQIR